MFERLEADVTTTVVGDDIVSITRRGVVERLADPYLTEHDRWVLRQFARFLGGVAPEPDPRVVRIGRSRVVPIGRSPDVPIGRSGELHPRCGWLKV